MSQLVLFRLFLRLVVVSLFLPPLSVLAADSPTTKLSFSRGSNPSLAILYDALIAELKKGGTAVYFVPFSTTGVDQVDQPGWWKECAISRMISVEGLEQAAAIRRAIEQLKLDVQFVESSEACVALSSYTYILGNRWLRFFITPDLNPVEVLRQSGLKDHVIQAQVLAHLQTTMAESPKFLFGFPMPHSSAAHPVLADLNPGESAIFRNSETREPVLLARLNWRQWQEMGAYFEAKQVALPKPPKRMRK